MLRLALARRGVVRSWAVHAVHHRPGAGVSIGYTVLLDLDEGGVRQRRDIYVLASTARFRAEEVASDDVIALRLGPTHVHIWEHPGDPALPTLKIACDPEQLAGIVGEPVDVELLGYRPTRRAVVRLDFPDGRKQFGKVVRPSAAADLIRRHEMLTAGGVPCPAITAVDERGFVLTEGLAGLPLIKRYIADYEPLLAGKILVDLGRVLDAIPLSVMTMPARPAWSDRCEHYAAAAATALPDEQARCQAVARAIRELRENSDSGPLVPTHGDFYEANVMVSDDGAVTGILDLDSIGPGYRVDDWGCLLGHLSVLPERESTRAFVEDWWDRLGVEVDPIRLASSAAGVVLSLVAGAGRSRRKNWRLEADRRLRVAEAWIERGRAAAAGEPGPSEAGWGHAASSRRG